MLTPGRRQLKFYQADVFTDQAFGGNPVAVFPDAAGLTDGELQQIAREMNLSETVFVLPAKEPESSARIRIFTPTREIPFAGHPILGTFFILGRLGRLKLTEPFTQVHYDCNLGRFAVDLHVREGEIERVWMAQPRPQFIGAVDAIEDVYEVTTTLGLARTQITDTRLPIEIVSTGLPVMIVPVRTLTSVRSITPDVTAIQALCSRHGANGIMVFTMMTVEGSAAVHTRMFAPSIGIPEDPATGSASGALGAYLVQNGVVEVFPTTEIVAEQGYEIDRPSRILIQVISDDDIIQTVKVGGQVVMVLEGTLSC